MRSLWIKGGRALWVLLALNAILLFVLSQWVAWHLLQTPSPRLVQGLAERGLSMAMYAGFFFVSLTVVFLVYFVVALLIFLRRPNDGFALLTAIFLLGFGVSNARPSFAEFTQFLLSPPLWYNVIYNISAFSGWTLLIAFLVLYPDGHFVPRWSLVLAVLGSFFTTAWLLFPGFFSDASTPVVILNGVLAVVFIGGCLYAQFWRYRHYSSPLAQQQTKWFVFALAIFLAATFLFFFLSAQFARALTPAESIVADFAILLTGGLAGVVFPIAIGIAILRYRLWDIDVIIRKTLTYTLVVALLAVVYFSSVILLQQIFANITGARSEVITVLSTLAIAALFVPLRNRVQDVIDRRFYRKKYDAQMVLQKFSETVRDETDLDKLSAELLNVVNETMQPKSVSVWLKTTTDDRRQTTERVK